MSKYYDAEIIELSDGSKWDFVLKGKDGKRIPIEVKEDYIGERTGNIAIEYFSRGKPSGINTTKSKYYVYRVHRGNDDDLFFLLSVHKLRAWIRHGKFWKSVSGGDKGSDTRMYLFKQNKILAEKQGFWQIPIKVEEKNNGKRAVS